MPDILHDFPIQCSPAEVFRGVATPAGIDSWWTIRSKGAPTLGATYELWFGPEYDWRAQVVQCVADRSFELEMTHAMPDWMGTRVRFDLTPTPTGTQLRFAHTGWPEVNEHYRISSFCWAMYLRLLRRNLEFGETVPYEKRLDV